MKIHNQLEYEVNGKKVVVYNTMLKGVLSALADFSPYFNYLCIGGGRGVNNPQITSLDNFICAFPMEIGNYNININNGNLYITKAARVRAISPMSISEVGVSKTENGEGLVNRFVLPTAIDLGAGEEVVLTVTINLEIEQENSNMGFVAGENPLIGAILGHLFLSEGENSFSVIKGNNRTETFESVEYKYLKKEGTPLAGNYLINEENFEITFSLSGAMPSGVAIAETIIAFGGLPVLRISNYDIESEETVITETLTADHFMTIRLTKPYMKEVVELYDKTSDALVINTDAESYGLELGEINYSPFGGLDYQATTERILSPDGKAIAFLVDGRLDYFEVYYGTLIKKDCSTVALEHMKDIRIFNGIMLVRCFNEEYGVHYTDYYYLNGDRFEKGEFSLPWENIEGSLWNIFRLNKCNAINSYIVGIVTDTNTYMGYLVQSDDKTTLTGTIYYALGKVLTAFYVTSGSVLEDAYGFGYKDNGSDSGAYVFKSTGYHTRTESAVLNLINNYGCKRIYAYNGYFYSTYDEKKLVSVCKILYFCDSFSKTGNLSTTSTIKRTFWAVAGNYTIELGDAVINIRYANGDMARTLFKTAFPTASIPLSIIDDIEIVNNVMLIFRKNGLSTVAIPIIENYSKVSPCRAGDSIEAKYKVVNLPGSDGGSVPLSVSLSLHI